MLKQELYRHAQTVPNQTGPDASLNLEFNSALEFNPSTQALQLQE